MSEENKHTWNHRVIRITEVDPITKELTDYYQIHEVHYTDGVPTSVTKDPVPVAGEDPKSIRWVLERMLFAADTEIIPMEYFDNLIPTEEEEAELDRIAEEEEKNDIETDLGGC